MLGEATSLVIETIHLHVMPHGASRCAKEIVSERILFCFCQCERQISANLLNAQSHLTVIAVDSPPALDGKATESAADVVVLTQVRWLTEVLARPCQAVLRKCAGHTPRPVQQHRAAGAAGDPARRCD